jgi:hypothetical protein
LKYLYKKTGDCFVTWLEPLNRYILFREPAFEVFRMWSDGRDDDEVATVISGIYNVPQSAAARFVNEIITKLDMLVAASSDPGMAREVHEDAGSTHPFSEHVYAVNGSLAKVSYGSSMLENQIHPKLAHLCSGNGEAAGYEFSLSGTEGNYTLKTGMGEKIWFTLPEELAGGLFLQFLKILHGIEPLEWMGVAHGSAVAKGDDAIIFMAPSGRGKSTIAALMVAAGFELVSDDFVPVSITEPEVHTFPAGLSVKDSAIGTLSDSFPGIREMKQVRRYGSNKTGVYLNFPSASVPGRCRRARALVFVTYDRLAVCHLEKRNSEEYMDEFLRESWVGNNPAAAARFMDWFFSMPVYTLRYSDNKTAVEKLSQLLMT